MRAPVLIAALGLATLATLAAPASAQPSYATLARHLDAEPVAVVRIDPRKLHEVVTAARKAHREVAGSLVLAGLASRGLVGANLTTPKGFEKAGFEADAPILVSVEDLDWAAAEKAWKARSKKGKPTSSLWRTRIVVGVSNRVHAWSTLKKLENLTPGWLHYPFDAEELARLLGAVYTTPDKVKDAFGFGVVAIGPAPFGGTAFVVMRQDALTIDILRPWRGGSLAWDTDRNAILARLQPRGRTSGAARWRTKTGAAALLESEGVTAWVDPERIVDVAVARRRAYAVAIARSGGETAIDPEDLCTDFRAIAARGAFSDVALALATDGDAVSTDAVWGLRGTYKLAAAFVIADDGLLDPHAAIARGAVVAGATYLRTVAPLRALPRPPALQGDLRDARRAAAQCGPGAVNVLWAAGWPQVAGAMLEAIAGVNGEAETLVSSVRNGAFAAETVALTRDRVVAALEMSFDRAAVPVMTEIDDTIFGADTKKTVRGAGRSYAMWGGGPLRAYQWKTGAGKAVFGGALGERSLRWYFGLPPASAETTGVIAELVLRPETILRQVTPPGPLGAALAAILEPVDHVEATLAVDGDLLRARAVLTP